MFGKSSASNEKDGKEEGFIASGLAAAKMTTPYKLMVGKDLRNTSTFGIRGDKGVLLRVDRPHKGVDFNHLNISSRYTKVKDPHTYLPPGSAALGSAATTVLSAAGKAAFVAGVAIDAYRVGSAIKEDFDHHGQIGQTTVQTAALVAAGWVGGFAGAAVGGPVGGVVGGLIGLPLGPAGSVPLGVVGSIIGCYYGGYKGSVYATSFVEDYLLHADQRQKLMAPLGPYSMAY